MLISPMEAELQGVRSISVSAKPKTALDAPTIDIFPPEMEQALHGSSNFHVKKDPSEESKKCASPYVVID